MRWCAGWVRKRQESRANKGGRRAAARASARTEQRRDRPRWTGDVMSFRPSLSLTASSANGLRTRIRLIPATMDAARDSCAGLGAAPDQPVEDWRSDAYIASKSEPRIVMYPNFLSSEEVDHLLDLSRWGAMEAASAAGILVEPTQALSWDGNHPTKPAKSGRTVSIHLPSPSDDDVIQAIEERCAAVTGIPIHPDEEPLGVRHTSTSTADECAERYCTALHVDTNQGGHFRCATVLIYLNQIGTPVGGETVCRTCLNSSACICQDRSCVHCDSCWLCVFCHV